MSRGSVAALLLVCSWCMARAGRFQDLPLLREGDTAREEATTEDRVDFSLHFNLFRNVLSTTRSAASEVATVGDGEISMRTVPEDHGASAGQDDDFDTRNSSTERYLQLWRHWFGGGQSSSTTHTPTSLAWTTAIDVLHLDSEHPIKTNVDVLKTATEACKPTGGSELQVDPEELTDSAWHGSTSPYDTVTVASRGSKNPDMNVSEPDETSKKNDFFHRFWGTESLTHQNGSINSERNVDNYSKVNAATNYDAVRSRDDNNFSAVTGITSSTKFLGVRSDDRISNVTKTKGFYNLGIKASSPSQKASFFQDVDNITGGIVASESETASDDAGTNSHGKKNEDAESSSITPIPITDTHFNSVADRPITNNTLGFRNDTVGTEFIDYMNASYFKNIPGERSNYNKEVLSNMRRNYTTLDDGISNILTDSKNENSVSSARLLSAGTSNSSFTDRIVIDVGDESNTPDKILFVNSTQYRLWHFILKAFNALKENTLELIRKISRPIQKLGHGLKNQFSNMAPVMRYNTLSQKSQVTRLYNGSKLNSAVDKSSTTRTSFPDGTAPSGENELNTDDFSGQTLGNMTSDVTIETTNDDQPTHHPESDPGLASWYPKSWRSKRQISLTAPENDRSTKPSEINVDSGFTTKINELSNNASYRTTKNCAWNYENALDYPEYFNTKVQTTTSQGIGLSPSNLWLEIKSWTASKAKLLNVSYLTALLHKKNNEDNGWLDDEYEIDDEDEAQIVKTVEGMNNYNQVPQAYTWDTTETNYYDDRLKDGIDSGLEDYYSDDEIYGETKARNKTVDEHENVVALK